MKNGLLMINKPEGFTSFDVVAKLRGILKTKKIGHGGTLDPNATGVLPVFIGNATKAIDLVSSHDKEYVGTVKLGITTDTQDIWGTVLTSADAEKDEQKIKSAIEALKGESFQLPPMYSALKINGVRLYDLARQGIEVDRQARKIKIYSIEYLGKTQNEDEYKFRVLCSKGTYVRTLCADIGESLGCGGCMTSLERTMALGKRIEECKTLSQVEEYAKQDRLNEIIADTEDVFFDLPFVTLSDEQTFKYKNGVRLDPKRVRGLMYEPAFELASWQRYRVHDSQGRFLGIGQIDYKNKEFYSVKMFLNED